MGRQRWKRPSALRFATSSHRKGLHRFAILVYPRWRAHLLRRGDPLARAAKQPLAKEQPMTAPHPPVPSNTHTLPSPPLAPVQQALISIDQYESSTYQKWFERHTGLGVDEAIALGLARLVTS